MFNLLLHFLCFDLVLFVFLVLYWQQLKYDDVVILVRVWYADCLHCLCIEIFELLKLPESCSAGICGHHTGKKMKGQSKKEKKERRETLSGHLSLWINSGISDQMTHQDPLCFSNKTSCKKKKKKNLFSFFFRLFVSSLNARVVNRCSTISFFSCGAAGAAEAWRACASS